MYTTRQKKLIWFLFIFSAIVLLINFNFLMFWYATRNGMDNGFHIGSTDYSILHWSMKVSYLVALSVVIWSGFETLGIYYPNLRPRFIYRYFVVYWIVMVMVGESYGTVVKMIPRFEAIYNGLFNGGPWLGVNGVIYSLIDAFQFISIHVTIPVICIVYASIYKYNEVRKDEVKIGVLIFLSTFLIWWLYCGILSFVGVPAPYPIIDWTPNDIDASLGIWIQTTLIMSGGIGSSLLAYFVLIFFRLN